jgi:hypothetical protein
VTKLRDALLALLLMAVGLRFLAWLAAPAIPLLVMLWVLVAIYALLFRR